jgi:hypothetical protein
MNRVLISPTLCRALFLGVFFGAGLLDAYAEHQNAQLVIKSVHGYGSYCANGMNWLVLKPGVILSKGTVIRAGENSAVDLVLNSSGTALRMLPNTLLEVTKLEKEIAGEEVITWTVLDLRSGGVIASQRKLDRPSTFQINTHAGPVMISGTEYLVQADGTVKCFAGRIGIDANFAGNAAAAIELPGGFSFDPITKVVVPLDPGVLAMWTADLGAVRQNSSNLKKEPGQIVMRLADKEVSPTKGNNGVGNGVDPQPPGNPPINDGPGTSPGNPGNKGGTPGHS